MDWGPVPRHRKPSLSLPTAPRCAKRTELRQLRKNPFIVLLQGPSLLIRGPKLLLIFSIGPNALSSSFGTMTTSGGRGKGGMTCRYGFLVVNHGIRTFP